MSLTELGWQIPSLGWASRVTVRGLSPMLSATALARWPGGAQVCESHLEVETSSSILDVEGSLLVNASATWLDAHHAEIRTDNARARIDFAGTQVVGSGTIDPVRPIAGLESLFRALVVLSLSRRQVFVIHASAVRRGDEGLLFLGASGAGKTTTARRLGREGFYRIADDIVALDLGESPPTIHPLPFERGNRVGRNLEILPARCYGAAFVRKGAATTGIAAVAERPRYWSEAVVRLPSAPDQLEQSLDAFAALCAVPVALLDVPPRGRLDHVVGPWLTEVVAGWAGQQSFWTPRCR